MKARCNLRNLDHLISVALNDLGLRNLQLEHILGTSYFTSLLMEPFQPFFVHIPRSSIRRTRTTGDKQITDEHPCPPLIKLLAMATALGVDFLPLTWRPALEILGEGLTGNVSQSPLDAQITFAFKRFNPSSANVPGCSDAAWLSSGYDALFSEIIVLQFPTIRNHPNVAGLEGLCWEIRKDSEEVWPVMIFRKADLGSLDKFISLPVVDVLGVEHRMRIGGEIAKGLLALHDCSKCQYSKKKRFGS